LALKWINEKLEKMVKRYKTNDPYVIAENKNIYVLKHNLHPEILGYYKYERRNKFIVLNSNYEESEQKFVCAHELGHCVFHPNFHTPFLRKNTFFSIERIECEANYFATHLLLYNEKLEDYETTFDLLHINGIPEEMERFL